LKQNISDFFDFSIFVVVAGEQGILSLMVLEAIKVINGGMRRCGLEDEALKGNKEFGKKK
jgi:hypothetical protein